MGSVMKKTTLIFCNCVVVLALSTLLLGQSVAKDDGMINEINLARQKNRAADVDITDIVRRYIVVGTNKILAVEIMHKNGFSTFEFTHKGTTYLQGRLTPKTNVVGFGDNVNVICKLDGEIISDVVAKINFRSF